MECLLLERFLEDENVAISNLSALINLVQTCDHENLQLALQDKMTLTILEQSCEDKVKAGTLVRLLLSGCKSYVTHIFS